MIYYDEYGCENNQVILMLPGAAALDTFSKQYFLSEKYHLIVPHLPGSGKSVNIIYNSEETISQLLALIDFLGIENAVLMGHSVGGQLATALVSLRPDAFKGALFLSPWIIPNQKLSKLYSSCANVMSFCFKMKKLIIWQCKYWGLSDEQSRYMAEYSKYISPEQYRAFFNQPIDLNNFPAYSNVDIPMLAVCGEKENDIIKKSVNLLQERNTHCKAVIVPRANHDFPLRKAQQLNELLLDFLDNLE